MLVNNPQAPTIRSAKLRGAFPSIRGEATCVDIVSPRFEVIEKSWNTRPVSKQLSRTMPDAIRTQATSMQLL